MVAGEAFEAGIIKLVPIPAAIDYTPMSIGDIRQFVFLSDSSTLQIEIVDTATRSDGKLVFVETDQYGNGTLDTGYYYTEGQFWGSCNSLDSAMDSSSMQRVRVDPYGEQRLALSAPIEGQWWYQSKEDTSYGYRICRFHPAIQMRVGTFQDVFGFEAYGNRADSLPMMTVCFSNGAGWITTLSGASVDSTFLVPVYIHTAHVQIGAMIPKRDPRLGSSKRAVSGLLGGPISAQGRYRRVSHHIKY